MFIGERKAIVTGEIQDKLILIWFRLQSKPGENTMKKVLVVLACAAVSTLFAQQQAPPKTSLKVGDLAPDFTISGRMNTGGKDIKLSDYRGKKVVVLAFFPAAFTGGWTKELTAYQSGIGKFETLDSQVLAISTDFIPTLAHWAKELNATYPLLSDHDHKISEMYGVLNPAMGVANRASFVIDLDGKIAEIVENSAALDPTGAETACSRLKHKNWIPESADLFQDGSAAHAIHFCVVSFPKIGMMVFIRIFSVA
jgi:peroxiredoxin